MISFVFKLLFSALLGGSLNYSQSEKKRDSSVIRTALLSVIAAAIFGSIILTSENIQNGLAFGSFLMLSVILFKVDIPIIKGISAVMTGMLVGLGFPVYAILFTVTVFILNRYLEQ